MTWQRKTDHEALAVRHGTPNEFATTIAATLASRYTRPDPLVLENQCNHPPQPRRHLSVSTIPF